MTHVESPLWTRTAAAWRRRWAGCRGGGRDRGAVVVEWAVLFPAFLVLLFAGIQAAEWYYTRSLCLAAADAGVRVGRQTGSSDAAAQTAAAGFLSRIGSTASGSSVSTAGSTTTVIRVEVTARAPRVLPIPGLSLTVTQSAQARREVFTTVQISGGS